jgi:hypothetical protein
MGLTDHGWDTVCRLVENRTPDDVPRDYTPIRHDWTLRVCDLCEKPYNEDRPHRCHPVDVIARLKREGGRFEYEQHGERYEIRLATPLETSEHGWWYHIRNLPPKPEPYEQVL